MVAPEARTPGESGQANAKDKKADGEIVADQSTKRKANARRIALAALAGIEARKLADGGWLVTRWGQYRELADDDAFDAWLARVGVRA